VLIAAFSLVTASEGLPFVDAFRLRETGVIFK
jgi:hypothetical protein